MFFIIGVSNKEQKIDFTQTVICKCCGKYGRIEVFEKYMYFMFFFIPIFKWNRKYFVKMSCCSNICEIEEQLGKDIKSGKVDLISEEQLDFKNINNVKSCLRCGYIVEDDFEFCPKCGDKLD